MLVICFPVPIFTLQPSSIKKGLVHTLSACLSILFLLEFYLYNSFWMCFIEPDPLDFSDGFHFLLDLLLQSLNFFIILGYLWSEHIFYNDDLESFIKLLVSLVLHITKKKPIQTVYFVAFWPGFSSLLTPS